MIPPQDSDSDSRNQNSEIRRKSKKKRWKKMRRAIMVAGALATILAIPVAYHIHHLSKDDPPSTPHQATTTTASQESYSIPSPPLETTPETEAVTESLSPGCYNGDDPTLCTSAHTKEIYSSTNGTCDDASLILHLGGTSETDLLSTGLSVEPVPGAEQLCSVTREEGLPASPLENLWKTDANNDGYAEGGELRRCYNHQGLPISCEDPHFSEVIYEGDHEIDCRTQYQSFADRSANTDKNLKISGFSEGDTFICRVEVQTTSDSLLHSVRNLGDRRPLIQ